MRNIELSTKEPFFERFQARGQAWNPMRPDVLELLESADHAHLAPIYYGSNHCFLVTLDAGESGRSLAVYKPARGEYPLYDFPNGTLYRREIGSWLINSSLGWWNVPPTVSTRGKYGIGSLQLFIESYTEGQIDVADLQRLALLDVILNNADRKADHCLLGEHGRLWGIDHGLTFHSHPKLRTVLWHFAGDPIASDQCEDLQKLLDTLRRTSTPAADQLRRLISASELRALIARVESTVQAGRFPNPRYKTVPYRW